TQVWLGPDQAGGGELGQRLARDPDTGTVLRAQFGKLQPGTGFQRSTEDVRAQRLVQSVGAGRATAVLRHFRIIGQSAATWRTCATFETSLKCRMRERLLKPGPPKTGSCLMRIANIAGRLSLMAGPAHAVDLADVSAGRFGPDIQPVYERWDELREYAKDV